MQKFKEYLRENVTDIPVAKDITVHGPKTNEQKLVALAKEYDWFTSMIDSSAQMKQAEDDNKEILKKLKGLGATKITHRAFSTPMAGIRVKEIDIK